MESGAKFTAEASFKLKRRRMTVAMGFIRAADAGERIAVLVCQNITRIKEPESMIASYSLMVERRTHEIWREKEQVERLLLNMMPRSAYKEYKSFGVVAPRVFQSVLVLRLDFEDIDRILEANDRAVIVSKLGHIYTAFDRIGEQFGCERVRTNGDSYFAVSGGSDPVQIHVTVAGAAVRYLRYLARRNESHPIRWQARLGLASGPVIGSMVSVDKDIYDEFGPAVEMASKTRARFNDPIDFREVLDLLEEAIALLDADGSLLATNAPFQALFGAIREFLLSGSIWDIFLMEASRHDLLAPSVREALRLAGDRLGEGAAVMPPVEYRLDGWQSYDIRLKSTSNGGFAMILTETIDRKGQTESDRLAELLMSNVLESCPANRKMSRIGDSQILYRTPAATDLLGPGHNSGDHLARVEERADFATALLSDARMDDMRALARRRNG